MSVVAIDFGTSNTVVADIDPVTKKPRTLKFGQISRCFETPGGQVNVVPTLVFVAESGQVILGEQVRSQRLGFSQPQRLFHSFKRDLAADYRPPAREINGQIYHAEYISELFIQEIWQQLHQQQIKPDRLIFTVPVGSFERYLDWFKDLANKLGVTEIQMVDESTAAALGYAVRRPGAIVLVVDFGGGTLDLSLVRTSTDSNTKKIKQCEVIAKSDAYIGGVDIDTWIVEYYLRKIKSSREEIKEIGWQNLLEIAERLKIKLSTVTTAKDSWFDDENFMAHDLSLNRTELEEILENQQFLEQMRQALDELLTIAYHKGISKSNIDLVALVGGSCLIPAVQQLICSYFGKAKVKLGKPFEAVAHGALVLSVLHNVEDYLHHSYAIRLWESYSRSYSFLRLFNKGINYPCKCQEPLILQVAIDGQKEIRLDIGEVAEISQAEVTYNAQGQMTSGHLNKHEDFRSLESHQDMVCVASLDPPGQLGEDRIKVLFEVNEDRILLATVIDLRTDKILVDRGAIAKLK
mgnify:CR=1 FL=1